MVEILFYSLDLDGQHYHVSVCCIVFTRVGFFRFTSCPAFLKLYFNPLLSGMETLWPYLHCEWLEKLRWKLCSIVVVQNCYPEQLYTKMIAASLGRA